MSADPLFTIPAERLPPGFAEKVDAPDPPTDPKPASTIVLARNGHEGMEVLLLKRHRASGFVPGAYVFPGGRTDEADADPALLELRSVPDRGAVPAVYWFAAVREAFEETGILLARAGEVVMPSAAENEDLERWRVKLMLGDAHLLDVLNATGARVLFDEIVYFAHWITPVVEPRRYDTRFFMASIPRGRAIQTDEREMVDAVWLTPRAAIERFTRGQLPMVFPTVKTLQELAAFSSVEQAMESLRKLDVEPVLPRLIRTGSGVGIVIDP